jgi:hypothetical protein
VQKRREAHHGSDNGQPGPTTGLLPFPTDTASWYPTTNVSQEVTFLFLFGLAGTALLLMWACRGAKRPISKEMLPFAQIVHKKKKASRD